jgi:Big-like domain-containing protein
MAFMFFLCSIINNSAGNIFSPVVFAVTGDEKINETSDISKLPIPKAADLNVTTLKATPLTITLNATGSNGLTRHIVSQPTNGELGTINQQLGTIEYKPSKDFVGNDTITYLAVDGRQASNVAIVTITIADSLDKLICSDGKEPDKYLKCADGSKPQLKSKPASTKPEDLVCSDGKEPDKYLKCADGSKPQLKSKPASTKPEDLVCSDGKEPDKYLKCADGSKPQLKSKPASIIQAGQPIPSFVLICGDGDKPDKNGKCIDGSQAYYFSQLVCSGGKPPDKNGTCPDGKPPKVGSAIPSQSGIVNPNATGQGSAIPSQSGIVNPNATGQGSAIPSQSGIVNPTTTGQLVCSDGKQPDSLGTCSDGNPPQSSSAIPSQSGIVNPTTTGQGSAIPSQSGIVNPTTTGQLVCSDGNQPDSLGTCSDGNPPQSSLSTNLLGRDTIPSNITSLATGQLKCSDGGPTNSSGLCSDGGPPQSNSAINIPQTSAAVSSMPIARDLSLTTSKNQPVTVTFSASGIGDLTAHIVSQPLKGTLGKIDQQAGTVKYTPDSDYVGTDTIRYLVYDGQQGSNIATVTIRVQG